MNAVNCHACGRTYNMGSIEFCDSCGERLQVHVAEPKTKLPLGLLQRLGLRKRNTSSEETPDDNQKEPLEINCLPAELIEAGWALSQRLASGDAIDIWDANQISENGSGSATRFLRYRTRVLTTPALYQALRQHKSPALPELIAHGTLDLGGARAAFELNRLPQTLQPLQSWLNSAPPSEAKALNLLPHLVDFLAQLFNSGVYPISFTPNNLLRDDDGRIVLDNCACLAAIDSKPLDYRPELENNALISRIWSAPESGEQLVVSPKSAIFSTGQLLVTALWGQPMDLASIRSGNVPCHTITEPRLARIIQGCLWIDNIESRWSLEQLTTAVANPLDQMPGVEDWSQLGPRAMRNAMPMAGRTYWRVEELLANAVLPQNWEQAITQLPNVLDWIENGSPWSSTAKQLRNQLHAGKSSDHILIKMAHSVIAGLPCTWRGLDFSNEHARTSLVNLAQRSLAEDATPEEIALVDLLFDADLRGAFVKAVQSQSH